MRDVTDDVGTAVLNAVGHRARDRSIGVARVLTSLPESWVPRSPEAWEGFAACARAVSWAVDHTDPPNVAALLNAKGDWRAFHRRLSLAHGGGDDPQALSKALRGCRDMWRAHALQVVLPAERLIDGERDHPTLMQVDRAAFEVVTSGRSLRRLLEASRSWHVRAAAIAAALPQPTDGRSTWEAILPNATVSGLGFEVLTDRAALVAEGADGPDAEGMVGLANCVGGYAGRCLEGETRILSVRIAGSPRWTRSSTAEVSWVDGICRVVEHAGHRNAMPSPRDAQALAAYVVALNSGELRATASSLPVLRGRDRTQDRCGYDWRTPGNWERVRDLWDPFLPGPARGASLGDVAGTVTAAEHGSWRATHWDPGRVAQPMLEG